MPFELTATQNFNGYAGLEFKEGDTIIAHIPIRAVSDKVHIINSCDESLVYYSVYGMGDTNPSPAGAEFSPGLTKQPFILRYAVAGGPAFWAQPPDGVALTTSSGNYQVHFTVPPLPDNPPLPACGERGLYDNVTVSISGMHSSDTFELCVTR